MAASMARRIGRGIAAVVGIALLIVIVAWLSGAFGSKIEPGSVDRNRSAVVLPNDAQLVDVDVKEVPVYVRAPGTVRAAQETAVGSRILATVEAVHAVAGQAVSAGDLLVELDRTDLLARQRQTQASIEAQTARLAKAQDDLRRIEDLRQRNAASEQELYDAQRAVEIAQADVRNLEERRAEVTAQLDYASVRAPFDAIVIDKQVDVGDLARPGDTLVTLYDPTRLQLEAAVPESVALRLRIGNAVDVELEALDMRCTGMVSEIVPQASPGSRSLLVKVTGPCPPGVVSGMFGRLLVQTGTRRQVLVPVDAVREIGQLEFVFVVIPADSEATSGPQRAEKQFVRTGGVVGSQVEILSGLQGDERILAEARLIE